MTNSSLNPWAFGRRAAGHGRHRFPRTWAPALAAALGLAGWLGGARAGAEPVAMTLHLDRPGAAVSPTLWGIFFEEINHAGDGGLYAELLRNRSFEDAEKPEHWTAVAEASARVTLAIDSERPLNPLNRRALRLTVEGTGAGGVANEGFWGVALREGEGYGCSFHARAATNFAGELSLQLESADGQVYARTNLAGLGPDWRRFAVRLQSSATDPRARWTLRLPRGGTVFLDQVSLFPERTWRERANGLRADLAEMLQGLRPAFVRFPGGCWVEGHDLARAYRWKETVGDVAHRRNQYNIWQYHSTHGLGYHEYLQLCEDLGATPLFVINCGMSHTEVVPLDQMGSWLQDALDAVEYANGPTNSLWGAQRARNGHPAPFGLRYLEIGNENGGPAYEERYALFSDLLKARFPDVQLVANEWGGSPKARRVEILDEHYYNSPEFFLSQAGRYDAYDRSGPRIYVGEYAVTAGCGQGNLRAAVGEAAFMTGMERNADVVIMASYAPLFANVNYKKWNPDLINFDSSRVYGTPSYWVQRLFSENRGDVVVPAEVVLPPVERPLPSGAVGLGTWMTRAEFKDLQVTQGDRVVYRAEFGSGVADWARRGGDWAVVEGALRQDALGENVQAVAPVQLSGDYTLSVKARKLSGDEGFLVMLHVRDADNWTWWNVGGWGNREHAVEHCVGGGKGVIGRRVSGQIETGRWYTLRVESRGQRLRCFLDGELVQEAEYERPRTLHTSATLDRARGEVVLKLVNAAYEAETVRCRLASGAAGPATVAGQVLTSASASDENSLEQPQKVAPRPAAGRVQDGAVWFELPANSVSVYRFKAQTR